MSERGTEQRLIRIEKALALLDWNIQNVRRRQNRDVPRDLDVDRLRDAFKAKEKWSFADAEWLSREYAALYDASIQEDPNPMVEK